MISSVRAPALVTTQAATNIESTTAVLNGTINPLGDNTSCTFQLGEDISYEFVQDLQPASAGTAGVTVNLAFTGLRPATTYHYRLSGVNGSGLTVGMDVSFTTAAFVDTDGDGMPNDSETATDLILPATPTHKLIVWRTG
jgi:phosphodiesterase/alkaline phosphatase D-like protein